MYDISCTFDTSQREISELNLIVSSNMDFIVVALEVFHLEISPLKVMALENIAVKSVTLLVSQVEIL